MLIAGNWKMFKGPHETRAFLAGFRPPEGVDVVICPPYVSLAAAVEAGVTVYAQNAHWERDGAYTGEVSAPMLAEIGVRGDHRAFRASATLLRDRRDGPAALRGCARGRASV